LSNIIYTSVLTHIRVVFDCSTKFIGISLNDRLVQGTKNFVGVLIRFRHETFVLVEDIWVMFLQIREDEKYRDVTPRGPCGIQTMTCRRCGSG